MNHTLSKETEIAKLLILLRKETQKSVEKATGIKTTNLSAWLRGKPQSISLARVSLLLNHLGVSQMKLSKDRLHDWQVPVEDPEALPRLLNLLGERDFSRATLYTAVMTEFCELESHVLIIDSFAPSPILRIKEDTTTYNGHFVSELNPGQKITALVDLDSIPSGTTHEFRLNLIKLAAVIDSSCTPAFTNLKKLEPENISLAPKPIAIDAFAELSKLLFKDEKNILANSVLRHIKSGLPIEVLVLAISSMNFDEPEL
jgi:hypothetical protein